jgi:phosphate-selective porin OprO/OprP
MMTQNHLTAVALALLGFGAVSHAFAEPVSGSDAAEIAGLKQQLRLLEQKIDKLQKQTDANRKADIDRHAPSAANSRTAATVKTAEQTHAQAAYVPVKSSALVPSNANVSMPNNRPTFCTDDRLNCVAITSRLHFDAGGYDYRPNSSTTKPQQAQNGVNARRARIGLVGTFMSDWDYALIYDFGGSQDNTSTIVNAFVTYKGIKGLYVDGGYLNVPYTLDQATSSNDITFLERASSVIVATNIASGNGRSAFGAHANGDWWWLGSYVTGPDSGFPHTTRLPVGATARGVSAPVDNQDGSLMLGADAEFLFDTGQASGAPAFSNDLTTLSDRIEVRIDPGTNALLNTGTLANVNSVRVLSAEAAGEIGSFYAQGEYFDYSVQRFTGLPDLHFKGGYVQASYVLTGEQRKYNPVTASYSGVSPRNPLDWANLGWGAWEIAARYSQISLNDIDVLGGELRNTTVGLNWYVNNNVRFMFNWIHGNVAKLSPLSTDIGAHYDVYAMRTQVAF